MTSSIKRHGITWTLDREYPVGEFANGDFWILGPATVVSVHPAPQDGLHGSMVNPRFGGDHGYDRRVHAGYDDALAVRFPVTLESGDSLVSTESWALGDPDHPSPEAHSDKMPGAPRPALRRAAVLTCIDTAPPAGAFRPAYAGARKTLYNAGHLRRSLLPQLPPPSTMPSLAEVKANVAGLWLDHKPFWTGRYTRPSENMEAPAWREWHCTRRTDDKSRSYRTCCTANGWVGAVLGARLLGLQDHWNWPALFDYTDDYMAERPSGWTRSWKSFVEAMWDGFR